ncbi:MAG TPA: tetratricopeptide repeat protein [Bacillota bacterium]|nr:tetratricopeptide repeat protein [Fastidiosipila sp.]HPX93441.1 tetratricopeptide repeat protein [Bacillota bacterium]HQB81213.1 tetratricopeptide repeat protein [Bacillota bacterium]
MIGPKHTFDHSKNKFSIDDRFVNRGREIKVFSDALSRSTNDYKIVMYHGVGGIGKSRLKKELIALHDKLYGINALRFHLDFSSPENRNPGDALISLVDSSESRSKFHYKFFEIAYAMYFKKKYPDTAYSREKEELSKKFDIGLSIVSLFDSGITQVAINIFDRLSDRFKTLRMDEAMKGDLQSFEDLDIIEIEERLPAYFERDLQRIKQKNPELNVVFFIDTFEALNAYESDSIHRNRSERWIKDFIMYFPGCLFVIFGREKLRWEQEWNEYIEMCELRNLETAYSYEYLLSAGIKEEAILDKIVESCQGYPFYLSLALKTYADIVNSGRTPCLSDFGHDYSEIIERFANNLSGNEVELLKVLSIPRFYTREIFDLLARQFVPGYSLSKFAGFNDYSFISREKQHYFIHLLMKKGLQKHIDFETTQHIHQVMADYYEEIFLSHRMKDPFAEMVYHKCEVLPASVFFTWFQESYRKFIAELQLRGEQSFVLGTIRMIIEKYGLLTLPIDLINIYVDIVHLGGNYEEAIAICGATLSRFPQEIIIKNKELLRLAIRRIHHGMFRYPVDGLIHEALEFAVKDDVSEFEEEYGELLFLIGGNLSPLAGEFELADKWLKKTDRFAKETHNDALEVRTARKMADMLAVKDLPEQALELCEKYLRIDSDVETRYHLYLLGSMGEIYRKLQRYQEAQYCFEKLACLASQRNLQGWLAHAFLGQAMLHLSKKSHDQGHLLVKQAEAIYHRIGHAWGTINAKTARMLFTLDHEPPGAAELEMLQCLRFDAQSMNYSYNVSIVDRLIAGKDVQDFYLLFL